MNEKIISIVFSTIVIFLFSLNFNSKWTNRNYMILKDKNSTWFWFRTFKIKETEENFTKLLKGLSLFIIAIMIIAIIFALKS